MNTAFGFVKANPTASALVVALAAGAGAGLATDAAITAISERIIGDFAGAKMFPDGFFGPIDEWIELKEGFFAQGIELIKFDGFGALPGLGLLAAQTRDPDIERAEFFLQRLHFSQGAAEVRGTAPKRAAVFCCLFANGLFGQNALDRDVEEIFQVTGKVFCFRKKQASIEGEDREFETRLHREIENDESCALKTGANGGAFPEIFPRPTEDFAGMCRFKSLRQSTDGVG